MYLFIFFQNALIPTGEEYNLYSFGFNDFPLSDDETCKATLRMFLDLDVINKFHVPYEVHLHMHMPHLFIRYDFT